MAARNDAERWGWVAQGFHWLVALWILGNVAVGLYMEGLPLSPVTFELYALHKSSGILLMAVVALRFAWRLANPLPHPVPGPAWEHALADAVHGALYACLFAIPLVGWLYSSASAFSVNVFGWFTLPDLIGPEGPRAERWSDLHSLLVWTLGGLLALHVAGALRHHFLRRDGVLARMVPFLKPPRPRSAAPAAP